MKKLLSTLAVVILPTIAAYSFQDSVFQTNTVDGAQFVTEWHYELSDNIDTMPGTATLLWAKRVFGENVTIPNILSDGFNMWTVTRIADRALANNPGLIKVTIPNTILEIGAYAFSNCTALTEVTLNYVIRYIGERAFYNTAVREIKVPDSLLDMGGNIAAGTLFTSSINIDDSSHFQYSNDGVLYNRDMTKLYSCPARAEGTVTIPSTVTNIAVDAFFGCNRISYLNLPATVNTIGTGAFNVAGIWPGLSAPESTPKLKSVFFNGPPPPNAANDIYSGAPDDLVNYALNSAWNGISTWKGRAVISIDGANPPVLSYTDANNIVWFYRIVNNEVELYNEDANGNPMVAVSPASTSGIDYKENEDSLVFRKALKIPNSINGFAVTKIGAHAFDGCAALSCLGIPASIREIGDYAFKGCTAISSIGAVDDVPFHVEANKITLPTGVTTLGLRPFEGIKVSSISLPYTLTTVKGNPVAGCAFVTSLTVDATCPSFVSDGNILYNKRKDTVVAVPANYNDASVSFPTSVTTIGDEALIGCGNVTQVAIPDSLTAISNRSFVGCTALKSLSFPASLATIGTAAFADCTSLVKITYDGDAPAAADDIYTNTPATMSSYVSESAAGFTDGTWKDRPLVRVSEGGEGGDDEAELRQTIGDVTWYFRIVDGYAEIWRDGATAVESASPILGLTLPSTLGGYIVKGIGEGALSGLGGITSISIPNTYERIGDGALTNCTVLASVEMSHGLRSIGCHPFEGTAIETIEIPDTVSYIDGNIFYGCNPSVSLSVGDNNPYFAESEEGALYSRDFSTLFACPMLTESITIPAATTSIESEAFAGCMLLKSVYFEGDAPEAPDGDDLYVDCHDSLTNFVQYGVESFGAVPGTWHLRPVLRYGEEPPEESEILTSADGKWRYRLLDDGTAEIWNAGKCAYLGESPVGSLQVPSTIDGYVVSAIGDGALANFAAVTSVSIPFSVTAIGEDVFTNCTLLAGFSVESGNLRFSTDGSTLFDYQKTEIIAVGRNLESFTAPATIGKIRAHAFDGCSLLASATFGDGIDEIGDGAFRGCSALVTVTFGGDAPTNAADDIYDGTPAELETVVEPDAEGWGALPGTWKDRAIRARDAGEVHGDICTDGTWYWVVQNGVAIIYNNGDCALVDPMTSGAIQVPDSVTDSFDGKKYTVAGLGSHALYNCAFVEEVSLPNTLKSIGAEAFSGTQISTLNIPAYIESIYGNPGAGCPRLTGFTVTEGNINFSTDENGLLYDFYGEELIGVPARATSVVIPESIMSIWADAFDSCMSLTNATYLCDAPTLGSDDIYADTSATRFKMYVAAETTGWDETSTTNMPASGLWPTESATGRPIISLYKPTAEGETPTSDIFSETDSNGLTWYYRVVDGVAEIWRNGETAVTTENPPIMSVALPETLGGYVVKGLGDGALSNLRGITDISIPNTYEWVGNFAFSNCTSLASANLGEGVGEIGKWPFFGTKITELQIPDSVESIDGNPIAGASLARQVTVSGAQPYFSVVDGVLYDKDITTMLACPATKDTITIPETMTNITDDALYGCHVTFIGEATDDGITWTYEIVNGKAVITGASGTSPTVTIPNTLGGAPVDKVEVDALNALTNVSNYASLSAAYTARNGVLYSANGTHLVRIPDTMTLPYTVIATASSNKVTVTILPAVSIEGGNVDRTSITTNISVISKSCLTNNVNGDISIDALLANVVVIDDYAFAGCNMPTNTMTETSEIVSGGSAYTAGGDPYVETVSVVSTVSSNYTSAISLPASVLKVCDNAFEGSNITILGDIPTVEVSDYPYSIDVPTYSADAAVNQAVELLPLESPAPTIVTDADYRSYFKVSAAEKPGAPGTYTVTAELDESAIEFAKSQNDVGAAIADVASSATDEATISAKPGLWYAIASSSTLNGPFEIVDCRLATGETVTLTMNRPSSESGYYRLIVDIVEITTCP